VELVRFHVVGVLVIGAVGAEERRLGRILDHFRRKEAHALEIIAVVVAAGGVSENGGKEEKERQRRDPNRAKRAKT
jgi:hypothetical protein